MKFEWTREQLDMFSMADDPSIKFLKVAAVAGSSKTTSLVEIAKRNPDKKILYLTFSKVMADEAAKMFPSNVECRTIHSLAYRSTVRQQGLQVSSGFYPRDMDLNIAYSVRKEISDCLDDYCLSGSTMLEEYCKINKITKDVEDYINGYLHEMYEGTLGCPHSFYLKLFHTLLANDGLHIPESDILMIDEAGDLTDLTIEVFKLMPSKKKIMVGDPFQSIFSFMNCSNAFEYFKDDGITAHLTKTFRCATPIAIRVQRFVRSHLDAEFNFIGNDYPKDYKVKTKAYIGLTNAGLLGEMVDLMQRGIKFRTSRSIDTILELPLVLANVGNGKPIKDIKYKAIELLRKSWIKHSVDPRFVRNYPNELLYIRDKLSQDNEVAIACRVVMKSKSKTINAIAKYVRAASAFEPEVVLTTAHSSKGMTFDEVTISTDFNERMKDDPSDELFRLYYVAVTRCRVSLKNAVFLG